MNNADWIELEPGVWGMSTPAGLDFVVEDMGDEETGKHAFQASQLLRTCCSSYEHHLKRFDTREEAMEFVEKMAADQEGTPDPIPRCSSEIPSTKP